MCQRITIGLLLTGMLCLAAAAQSPGEQAARDAVDRFGRAMTGADAAVVRPLLPQEGKVRLELIRLGPETGSFSANQVEALLAEFLAQGSVRTFKPLRVEHDDHGVALAATRLDLTDKQGREGSVELHLFFKAEGAHWVLREIRETPR